MVETLCEPANMDPLLFLKTELCIVERTQLEHAHAALHDIAESMPNQRAMSGLTLSALAQPGRSGPVAL